MISNKIIDLLIRGSSNDAMYLFKDKCIFNSLYIPHSILNF